MMSMALISRDHKDPVPFLLESHHVRIDHIAAGKFGGRVNQS